MARCYTQSPQADGMVLQILEGIFIQKTFCQTESLQTFYSYCTPLHFLLLQNLYPHLKFLPHNVIINTCIALHNPTQDYNLPIPRGSYSTCEPPSNCLEGHKEASHTAKFLFIVYYIWRTTN